MTLIQIQAELTSFRRTSAECDSDSVPFHELESGSDLKALLHSYLFYEYTNFMLALPYEFIYLYNTLVNIHHRQGGCSMKTIKQLAEEAWATKDYEPEDACTWGYIGGAAELLNPEDQTLEKFKEIYEACKAVGFSFIICYADYAKDELGAVNPEDAYAEAPILAGIPDTSSMGHEEPTGAEWHMYLGDDRVYAPWAEDGGYLIMGIAE